MPAVVLQDQPHLSHWKQGGSLAVVWIFDEHFKDTYPAHESPEALQRAFCSTVKCAGTALNDLASARYSLPSAICLTMLKADLTPDYENSN